MMIGRLEFSNFKNKSFPWIKKEEKSLRNISINKKFLEIKT